MFNKNINTYDCLCGISLRWMCLSIVVTRMKIRTHFMTNLSRHPGDCRGFTYFSCVCKNTWLSSSCLGWRFWERNRELTTLIRLNQEKRALWCVTNGRRWLTEPSCQIHPSLSLRLLSCFFIGVQSGSNVWKVTKFYGPIQKPLLPRSVTVGLRSSCSTVLTWDIILN